MAVQIQYRRGPASEWTGINPTLALGEPGYETDTGKIKIGTGSLPWNDLVYTAADSFLNGEGAPDASLGKVGDFYLDTTIYHLYGPKTAMVGAEWGEGVYLTGNTIRTGTTAPDASVGRDGDFYIDTVANQIYGPKTDTVGDEWGSPTNLQVVSIDDLNDVDTSTAPPQAGEALVWDDSNSVWKPGPAGAEASGLVGQIQYNDGASPVPGLAASNDLAWDDTAKELSVGGDINLDDGGSFSTTVQAVTPTANRTISFPDATGTVALVAGSTNAVQYNAAGAVAGSSNFTFDGFRVLASAISYFSRRPPLHRGSLFYKTAATAISVTAGAVLNGVAYNTATAVTMPGSFTNNTDYAIWQNPTTGELVADASFTTAPAGATGGSIVGGFHYIPSGRPTAVNSGSPTAAAEILEYSLWDLTWRPTCPDPRGMTCVDGRFWCDLYFCGSTSYAGSDFTAVPSSKIGLTIADSNNPPLIPAIYGGDGVTAYSLVDNNGPGSWYDFAEVASSFGKRLISWLEFQHAAFGGPENGSRGTDPGTVIWERASLWGLAQSTGTLWSWGADVQGNINGGWTSATGNRGDVFQSSYSAVRLGGQWTDASKSGSRCAHWNTAPSVATSAFSARFAAGHLVLT
jgi:hypothetical protein